MKKLGIAAVLAAATALPAVAGAQQAGPSRAGDAYGGLDFSLLNIESVRGLEDQATGVRGRLGFNFTPVFGLEGHLGLGLTEGSDTPSDGIGDVDLGVDYWAGVYARGNLPVADRLNAYGLLGFSRVSFDIPGYNTDTENDLSYGVGADYMLDERLGVTAEWLMVTDKENAEVSAWSIGAKFIF